MQRLVFCIILITNILIQHLVAQTSPEKRNGQLTNNLLSQLKQASGKAKVNVLNQLAEAMANSQPVKARNYAQEAIELAQDLDFEAGQAHALKNVGIIYQMQGNQSQALQYFLNALRMYEKLQNSVGIAQTLNNVGIIYQQQKKYEKARQYYERVLKIDEQTRDLKGQASTLNNLGDIYYQQDQYTQASAYYEKSLQIRQQMRDEAGIAVSLKNIGLVHYVQNDYLAALRNFFNSLALDTKLGNQASISSTDINIANTYLKIEKIDSALYYATKGYESAERIGLEREKAEVCLILADIHSLLGDYEKAFGFQAEYQIIQDLAFSEENAKKIEALQTSYELEKKQTEVDLAHQRNRNQLIIIYASSLGLILLFALAYVLYQANARKKRDNQLLQLQNAEINQQKEEITAQRDLIEEQLHEIEQKNREITEKNLNIESSINYALTIQQAILPKQHLIDAILATNFIFYRPRDVVSGDFYWFYHLPSENGGKGKAIISAIDCTGHGVPGAFMSMIGDSLLNQIVIDKNISEAHLILNELHKGVRVALSQGETHNRDGMDMALCVIDLDKKNIQFAGAKNPLVYLQNQELKEIKAEMYSVGGWDEGEESERIFSSQTISYAEATTTFYIYSDGYQDQFGGPKTKKFMRSKLKELFLQIHQEPMVYQEQILADTFEEWKGSNFQVDDILIIGIRVS
ncbi:MAG: tetratricopeptide repeat protein [Microscillaceae bacterium]|jgi:serine phosphatase RsbU (regulator of sigma subunit)/tetratricopeptide (TPR) repeat protein|nr:tetratricopeptide repeat protein [Microscillaceae bacterium]